MKRKYFFFLLLLISAATTQAQIQHFEWQGIQREYLVKIPEQHDETMPVMYFLHGLGDNITRLDNEFHFQQIADYISSRPLKVPLARWWWGNNKRSTNSVHREKNNGKVEKNHKIVTGKEKVVYLCSVRTIVLDYPGKFPARGKPTPTLPKNIKSSRNTAALLFWVFL